MPQITIYSTQTCPYCHMLREFLKSKDVAYKEVMIDEKPQEAQRLMDMCGSMGTPCTHIKLDDGKEVNILGFDKPKFEEVLGLKK